MKRFIAEKLHSSWRWVHRDINDFNEERWCKQFELVFEKPKKYDWVEIKKGTLKKVSDNSEEIVDWYTFYTFKHNRLDDKIRRFFNLSCTNYRTGKTNVFWQNLCERYERFVDKVWEWSDCK